MQGDKRPFLAGSGQAARDFLYRNRKYKHDEMKPSIDVAKKLAKLVGTTVGCLLCESNDMNVLKDPAMLKRLNDIQSFPEKEREHILYTLDALIKNAKPKSISE